MARTISIAVATVGLCVGYSNAQSHMGTTQAVPDATLLRDCFPTMVQHKPLASRAVVHALYNQKGDLLGWVFCTDQLPPVVRGKRGEIGVWVALGREGKIRGLEVGQHREDKKWFNRIRMPFYHAFKGKPADGSGGRPDAVTSATLSSKAIINDVFGACKSVLNLHEVRSQLKPAENKH